MAIDEATKKAVLEGKGVVVGDVRTNPELLALEREIKRRYYATRDFNARLRAGDPDAQAQLREARERK